MDENDDTVNKREGVVICGVSEGGTSCVFRVIQDSSYYLTISKESDSVTNVSGQTTFTVNTNADFSIRSNASWATASKEEISDNVWEVTVTYKKNVPYGEERTAKITFVSFQSVVKDVSYTLTQAESVANYSEITAELSYYDKLADGGKVTPALTYSQTWGLERFLY